MAGATSYRDEAAKLRRAADNVQSPVIKRQMLEIAAQYELLARSVEAARFKWSP
jgi:hypothetical protein